MDFNYSENQKVITDTINTFVEREIVPFMDEWDEKQYFPKDLFRKFGELGMMGVLVPEEYGGSGLTYDEYVTIISKVSQTCGSIGLSLAAHNSLCTGHILKFGNEEQKKKYLPNLASGKHLGAWGLTEPSTGSDAMRMRTVAKKEGDYWIINGTKNFITHAISGDVIVVVARTGELGDSRGISAFIVNANNEGVSSGKKENKLGMRASETAELIFTDCKVHQSNVLGNIGEGFLQAMKILDGGRISIAALSLGIAKGAYEASLKYSKERSQFGKKISDFQAISFKLADMATDITAAELLIYRACELINKGETINKESAMAKYFSSELAVKVSSEAVQIFGGYGFVKDFPVEKFYRDSKLCTIGEGTSEIQKLVISKKIIN